MNSIDMDVLKAARDWRAGGHRVTLATVVQTWPTSPRRPGAMFAIRGDGATEGSLADDAKAIEQDIVRRVRGGAGLCAVDVLLYGANRREAERFGLPMGATMRVVLEPLPGKPGWVEQVLEGIVRHQTSLRTLDLTTGQSEVHAAEAEDKLSMTRHTLQTIHGPCWRLLLVGANPTSRCLAEMALALDYEVTVCEPRPSHAQADWLGLAGIAVRHDEPDHALLALEPDGHTAVAALTDDTELDDAALIEALRSSAFYVGALGSRQSHRARRSRLQAFDLTPQEVSRLHAPLALPTASRSPAEVAVHLMAEMTAQRHRAFAFHDAMAVFAGSLVRETVMAPEADDDDDAMQPLGMHDDGLATAHGKPSSGTWVPSWPGAPMRIERDAWLRR